MAKYPLGDTTYLKTNWKAVEPLLLTVHRAWDAFSGAVAFLLLSRCFGMYTEAYLIVAFIIFFVGIACFHVTGLYRLGPTTPLAFDFHYILVGCAFVYAVLVFAGYVFKHSQMFSRSVVLSWMFCWPALVALERAALRLVLRDYRNKGRNASTAVIAGAGPIGERLSSWIDGNLWIGTDVLGFFDDRASGEASGRPILGDLESLPAYVREQGVDAIYLTLPWGAEEKMRWLLKELADTTASIYVIPDVFYFDLVLGGNIMYLDGLPAISLRDTPLSGVNTIWKRIEDITLSSIFLILLSPVMLCIALAIKLTSRGPVLFKQWRYGLNGQPIMVYKFRTMTVCEDGYTFKQATRCDPRVTPLGAFLRRTSLDEWPQFINVLQGRMSIVGPRPHPIALNEEYRKLVPGYMLRHKVKPGITGLAQVNGWRGETETLEKMENRVACDLEYLRTWSIGLDLKIILETVMKNAWKTNAY